MKPLQQMMLRNLAAKFDEDYTNEDIKFFCNELVARFPLLAEDMVQYLNQSIAERDQYTIDRFEEIYQQ